MAELVGLITGIGTIVATAFKISKMIVEIADELGTAGVQIRAIATDTKAMALVLHNLKARLKRDVQKINTEAKEVLKESIDLCASEMQNMDRHLTPLCGSGESQRMDFKQKAMWLFAKTRISTTKASLDSMKLTLSLLLSTLEYMEGNDVEEIVEENIHQMISTTTATKDTFLKAQRVDMAREIIYERSFNHQQSPEENRSNLPSPSSTLVDLAQIPNLLLAYEASHERTPTSTRGDSNEDAHTAAMAKDHERQDTNENIDGDHILSMVTRDPGFHDSNQESQTAAVTPQSDEMYCDEEDGALVRVPANLDDNNLDDDGHRIGLAGRHEPYQDSQVFEQVNHMTDWTLMCLLPDDSFLQIADHIRLQKTVSGFALDTMAEMQTASDICITPGIEESAPSGPGPSYSAPTVESEDERQDSDGAPQLRIRTNEEAPSQIPGSLPPDDNSSANTSRDPGQRRSIGSKGSSPGWAGGPTRDNIYSAQDRMNNGDAGLSQPRQTRHPWGNERASSRDSLIVEPGAYGRQTDQNPVRYADTNSRPYDPMHQGSGPGAGSFPYNPFGPFTGLAPQAPWGYPADVVDGPNYTLPRHNWGYRAPAPPPFTDGGRSSPETKQSDSQELKKLKAQLEALQLEKRRAAEASELAKTEQRIREEVEREFRHRMEAMRQAQEEAKEETDLARTVAEEAARERLEEYRKADEVRREELESLRIRTELEVRKNMEQAAMAKKQRQKFIKYFKRS